MVISLLPPHQCEVVVIPPYPSVSCYMRHIQTCNQDSQGGTSASQHSSDLVAAALPSSSIIKAALFLLVNLALCQSFSSLVLNKGGALVPEETPGVLKARELHESAAKAAEAFARRSGRRRGAPLDERSARRRARWCRWPRAPCPGGVAGLPRPPPGAWVRCHVVAALSTLDI